MSGLFTSDSAGVTQFVFERLVRLNLLAISQCQVNRSVSSEVEFWLKKEYKLHSFYFVRYQDDLQSGSHSLAPSSSSLVSDAYHADSRMSAVCREVAESSQPTAIGLDLDVLTLDGGSGIYSIRLRRRGDLKIAYIQRDRNGAVVEVQRDVRWPQVIASWNKLSGFSKGKLGVFIPEALPLAYLCDPDLENYRTNVSRGSWLKKEAC